GLCVYSVSPRLGVEMPAKYTIAEAEERSGVPAATLRQWERRYGVPRPQRSGGGYRLYSDENLVEIRSMRGHIADGVSASRAAELVREQAPATDQARPPFELAEALTGALLAFDAAKAEALLSEAYALHAVEDVLLDVVRPAMVRIGDLWHQGQVSVATEHYATNFVQGRLRLLLALMARAPQARRVVVACAPGERHELGALMLAIMLRRAGLDVVYLGSDTPLEDLVDLTKNTEVAAVFLSAARPESVAALRKERSLLSRLESLLVLGGRGFEGEADDAAALGATFLGNDLRSAVPTAIRLLEQAGRGAGAR